MSNELEQVEEIIGYKFKNFFLLQQAFVRRSFSQENGGQNNEVLEFVGDKALDLAVIRILTEKFGVMTEDKQWNEFKLRNPKYFKTKTKEGIFTDIKKDLVEKKALSTAMTELGFNRLLIMGKGDVEQHIEEKDSVKEDLFEAIVGAVTIDCDFDMDIITNVVKTMIDFDAYFNNEEFDNNYVGKVQEWCQTNGKSLPVYTYGSDFLGNCVCSISIEGVTNFYTNIRSSASSKTKARMECAKEAYIYLKEQGFILNEYIEAVGEPEFENCLRQINELVQKQLLSKPKYEFSQEQDEYGNLSWVCKATVDEIEKYYFSGQDKSKKDAQKIAVFHLLEYVMEIDE